MPYELSPSPVVPPIAARWPTVVASAGGPIIILLGLAFLQPSLAGWLIGAALLVAIAVGWVNRRGPETSFDVAAPEADRDGGGEAETRLLDALFEALSDPVLVIAGDTFGPLDPQDLGRVSMSLTEAAKRAADAGVKLALEFDARASFPNNLQSAVALVEDVGLPSLGLCLDWFQYTVGPSKPLDLYLLSADNLAHVQLSDIADVPREMASDADRILPGEGSSPPDQLIARLREIGYQGSVVIELHNPALWRVPPRQFGEIAMTALRKLLGQAAM